MKIKALLVAAMACASMSAFAINGSNTTAPTDSFYVSNVTVAGDTVTLEWSFKNANAYSAMQWFGYFDGGELIAQYDEEQEENMYTIINYDGRGCSRMAWAEKYVAPCDSLQGQAKLGIVWYDANNKARLTAGDGPLFSTKVLTKGTPLKVHLANLHYANGNDATLDGDGPEYDFTWTPEPTGVNDINVAKSSIKKVYENGQIVIYNGDVKYNVMGAQIK